MSDRIVTGQNPASAIGVAAAMTRLLKASKRAPGDTSDWSAVSAAD